MTGKEYIVKSWNQLKFPRIIFNHIPWKAYKEFTFYNRIKGNRENTFSYGKK